MDDLLEECESGRMCTLAQVPEAISKLNANILDIAHLIPPSFYQVENLLTKRAPVTPASPQAGDTRSIFHVGAAFA